MEQIQVAPVELVAQAWDGAVMSGCHFEQAARAWTGQVCIAAAVVCSFSSFPPPSAIPISHWHRDHSMADRFSENRSA